MKVLRISFNTWAFYHQTTWSKSLFKYCMEILLGRQAPWYYSGDLELDRRKLHGVQLCTLLFQRDLGTAVIKTFEPEDSRIINAIKKFYIFIKIVQNVTATKDKLILRGSTSSLHGCETYFFLFWLLKSSQWKFNCKASSFCGCRFEWSLRTTQKAN